MATPARDGGGDPVAVSDAVAGHPGAGAAGALVEAAVAAHHTDQLPAVLFTAYDRPSWIGHAGLGLPRPELGALGGLGDLTPAAPVSPTSTGALPQPHFADPSRLVNTPLLFPSGM